MGLLSAVLATKGDPLPTQLSTSGELPPAVILAEALGATLSSLPMNRSQAIQIPAVARSRNLLVGAIAPLPLVALRGDQRVSPQPSFLYRTKNILETPYERMAWTVDDLIFHGLSLWAVERGAAEQIVDAARIPRERWTIRDGLILVQIDAGSGMVPVDAREVILFNGTTNGLLADARDTLNAAQAIERAYVERAQNPIPLQVVGHVPGTPRNEGLTEPEAQAVLAQWKNARRAPGGSAIGYLPPTLQLDTPGSDASSLLEQARNAVRIDVANHTNVPVAMLDGGVSEESLTYRNADGEVSRFYRDLAFWLDPIQHRLSMDDVVPAGQRVRFDLATFDTPAPASTGVPTED
ncbi:phage portal protein [Agrococcus terreus]|uniref:phage portal protein n=1 Tax=Agrococcus terreus TaxID=574649 RepID=UPI003850D6C7